MSDQQSRKSNVNGRPSINVNFDRPVSVPPKLEIQLDVAKLHSLPSEQQDLYLFTFATDLEKYVGSLELEQLNAKQTTLNEEILKVISLTSPPLSKAVRNQLGRTYDHILSQGSRKILFETVNKLAGSLSAGKGEKDIGNKHAAAYCLGEVYKAAGDSAINLSSLACSSLLKLLKPAQNHAGLRASIFQALAKVVGSIGGSIEEVTARDIWKQAQKSVSSEKAALVQVKACGCLEQLVRHTTLFDNTNDFETLKNAIWKAAETAIPAARHAAASCLAAILVKSYAEDDLSGGGLPKVRKPKKANKSQTSGLEEAGEEISRPGTPTSNKRAVVKIELSLVDILKQLSAHYLRQNISNKARACVAICYVKVLTGLSPSIVQATYGKILDHLLKDLLGNAFIAYDRHRLLLTRKFVHRILANCIGAKILGEAGRLTAARLIVNDVLKNYPQVLKESQPEPSKHALVSALDALAALIKSLGSAFRPAAETSREALLQVLQHQSYTVQIHAAYCLKIFVLVCPQQLLSCASICMNTVSRELGLLGGARSSPRRCIGYANGLAAVLSVSPSQPLYSSLEICARVLSTAIELLKSSGKADLRIAGIQVQVAWIMIGGLMALGPTFVKIHLPQFLLLWRNALPKPLTKENTAQRDQREISYLTHVRECTLGSILLFLEFNGRLITADVAKRVATMLQNTIEYLDNLPRKMQSDDGSQRVVSSLTMKDLILMVRRRVLQCYAKLISSSPRASGEVLTQSNLLTSAVSLFADPEAYFSGTLGSSIANTTFENIWDVSDNYAFGITGLVRGSIIAPLIGETEAPHRLTHQREVSHTSVDSAIDEALASPISGAQEHDSVCLHTVEFSGRQQDGPTLPDSPATEVVNSAISLFATALPLQSPRVQEGVLEQLATFLASAALQKDPGRRAAVAVNAAMALLGALKVAGGETMAEAGDLKYASVERTIEELIRALLVDQDPHVRHIAYEALGRLCNSSGNAFTANEVNSLIDTIVTKREPNIRAGCAMGLGSIHYQVGGMAAGFHLKKIQGILMSLCGDPSPVVHISAIEALSKVADSAGLTFSAHVSSTLGLLAQLWTRDSHNEECSLVATSNAEIESPTAVSLVKCVDSLINVLGPDLQDMSKPRELMLTLLKQFDADDIPMVQAMSLRAWEHIYLYDPRHVNLGTYLRQLQRDFESPDTVIRDVAIDGLYNLMRKDAERVLAAAQHNLEEQIWQALNNEPGHEGIRNIILSWLGQSSLTDTDKWITRCQQILTKTAATSSSSQQSGDATTPSAPDPKSAGPNLQDEEIASFAAAEGKEQDGPSSIFAAQELLRWQVRAFGMQCLSDLVAIVGKDLDLDPTESMAGQSLQNRIADVVRLAFLASTASVTELQVSGLRLIDQVLRIFGTTPDPDFQEALLLEQYQAQISSALTPAFAADSSPDLAAAAVDVCATFISTGLVTDVERMGRILKLLVTALESFTDDAQDSAVGELKGLSSNAQTMVRMAVLSAWAELQVASMQQEYLVKVVKPFTIKLTPLWLSSLQEFARLRFEPDISNNTGPARPDEGLDVVYAALNRQTLLKFYQDSWLKLVHAIASLIDQDSDFVFDALDGKSDDARGEEEEEEGGDAGVQRASKSDINYRDEPAAFFFVLFGIVIESLTTRTEGPDSEKQTLEILSALKRILRPSVSGNAVFQDTVFSEAVELFDRLALTEGLDVQLMIVDIARNLCVTHPSARSGGGAGDNDEHLSEDIEQLFELTRIMVLVLAGVLPNLAEQNLSARPQLPDEAFHVIQRTLEALVDAADIFPSVIKTDLHASILHIFATILGTGICQANVVPQALPVFKRFLQKAAPRQQTPRKSSSSRSPNNDSPSSLLIHSCLERFLSILSHAQRRDSESSLACAKNTLFATTILLTTASSSFSPTDPLLPTALDAMLDCLHDLGLAKVVAGCLRSLLTLSPKTATDEAIARHLLPRLLNFVADPSAEDPENARSLIAQALTAFASSLATSNPDHHHNNNHQDATTAAISLILPALLAYAASSSSSSSANTTTTTSPPPNNKAKFPETATRLLELASGPLTPAFKACVANLSKEQRVFMEQVIREGGGVGKRMRGRGSQGGGGVDGDGEGGEGGEGPRIELKMNFG